MTWLLWALPTVILLIGAVPLIVAIGSALDEAAALRGEVRRAGQLRPALVETGRDFRALRAHFRRQPA